MPQTKTRQAVVLTARGGPEVLQVRELPMPDPGPGELRVAVRATGVGATDILMRRGTYRYAPPIPFVPGYESVGIVDAVGAGVTGFWEGDRVCALLVYGGYATHVVRGAEHWVKVPDGLDDVQVAALILNYVTAYQMIHRVARLQTGQAALVNAATGGVGQALLDLLRAHGVKVVGAASAARYDTVRSYGAEPIEGRASPLDISTRKLFPDGVDAAFDGVAGAQTSQCILAARRGGTVAWYGFVGVEGTLAMARSALWFFALAPLLGRHSHTYGITTLYEKDPRPFREDLPKLFELLAAKTIAPRIAETFPLLAAREANERLEAGGVDGKLVLVAER